MITFLFFISRFSVDIPTNKVYRNVYANGVRTVFTFEIFYNLLLIKKKKNYLSIPGDSSKLCLEEDRAFLKVKFDSLMYVSKSVTTIVWVSNESA